MSTTTPAYEPDDVAEDHVMYGLLAYPDFLKVVCERRIKPQIFCGAQHQVKRKIADLALNHWARYQTTVPLDHVFRVASEEAVRGDRDVNVEVTAYRIVAKAAFDTSAPPATILPHLDRVVEIYKCIEYVRNMREAGDRYFKCGFRHKQHELCEGCPVFTKCKQMQDRPGTFADRLISMTTGEFQQIQEVTAVTSIGHQEVISKLNVSVEQYDQRLAKREAGGENYTAGIKTPWPRVTELMAGGWRPKRMYGIWAKRKEGKTTALLNVAEASVRDGKNVLLFHMEDTPDEITDKMAVLISGISQTDYLDAKVQGVENVLFRQRVAEYQKAQAEGRIGRFYTCYGPLRSLGISTVIRTLDDYASRGIRIDQWLFDHHHVANLERNETSHYGDQDHQLLLRFLERAKSECQRRDQSSIISAQLKLSGERKGQARGADALEEPYDAIFDLEDMDGWMQISVRVARYFGHFSVKLDDYRDRMLLPQSVSQDGEYASASDLVIPSKDFLHAPID